MRLEYARISGILHRIRKEKNLTQAQMAEQADCSLRSYQKIESGESLPGYHTLASLVENLGIDPRRLFLEEAAEPSSVERIEYLLQTCNDAQLKIILDLMENLVTLLHDTHNKE